MAGEVEGVSTGGRLQAGQSLHHAFVQFVNRSARRVDIIWLNYSGFCVKYKTLLPNQMVDVNTFVGHPWIFRDSDSGDRMVVQWREVFEPMGWSEQEGWPPQRKVVDITIPVFSLQERCMQIIRRRVPASSLDKLDLPVTLVHDLKNTGVSRNFEEPRTQNPG